MIKTLAARSAYAVAALSFLFFSLPLAQAAGVPYAIQHAESSFFLGYDQLTQNYAETANGTTADAETGSIPALTIGISGISSNPQGGLYWRASYTHANGSTHYNGATLGGTPVQTTTANTISEWHGRLGEAFGFSRVALIPYLGVGAHKWVRNVGNGSGAGGVETYTDGHIGIGLLGDIALTRHWVLGAHILEGTTVGAQIHATVLQGFNVNTSTNTATPVYGTSTGALGDRPYWDVGLKAVYLINSTWRIYLRARQTHFAYGASAPLNNPYAVDQNGNVTPLPQFQLHEPDSRTTQTLYTIGVGAHFQ
jgi:hypothetical protein